MEEDSIPSVKCILLNPEGTSPDILVNTQETFVSNAKRRTEWSARTTQGIWLESGPSV
jgi:hypothetical protein